LDIFCYDVCGVACLLGTLEPAACPRQQHLPQATEMVKSNTWICCLGEAAWLELEPNMPSCIAWPCFQLLFLNSIWSLWSLVQRSMMHLFFIPLLSS
jgi:hypothetical protein